jgi:hypothetical protein
VIELYAIADHPGPPLPSVAPLRAVPAGDLAAICAPAEEREVSPETLWRHEEVVEALMRDRDLLPVRYGTVLEDDAAVARAVTERRDELTASLARVRGAAELSVRAVAAGSDGPGDEPGDATSGAEYLRTRARSSAARDAVAKSLHEPLAALARADVRRTPRPPAELLRAAYLVDRDAVATFTRLVARLDERNPDLHLLCTGPWPPYSFAEP